MDAREEIEEGEMLRTALPALAHGDDANRYWTKLLSAFSEEEGAFAEEFGIGLGMMVFMDGGVGGVI